MQKLWKFFFGDRSVAMWTVISGVLGLVSAVIGWVGAAHATSHSKVVTKSPNAAIRIVYSPVPTPVVTVTPSPVLVVAPSPTGEPVTPPESPGTGQTSGQVTGPTRLFLADRDTSGGSGYSHGVMLQNKSYDRSTTIECNFAGETTTWLVAGYQRFTTTVGIADDANGAVGTKMNVSFTNQDNQSLGAVAGVSLGHPKPITFPLRGTIQMQVRCQESGGYSEVSLGDAVLERAQ
ncbi:MAG: hypothetical protein QOJ50_2218 [Cryptosporangiaceae bacterium]|nr:hypothetical protein [Cryptosporangiaceae bacterium]